MSQKLIITTAIAISLLIGATMAVKAGKKVSVSFGETINQRISMVEEIEE